MGASRTLLRKLDLDLIERIEAGGKIEKRAPIKSRKKPRPGFTYRQNGRGRAGSIDPWAAPRDVFILRPYRGSIGLNRSQNWPSAKSYAHAREIGPSSEPVR